MPDQHRLTEMAAELMARESDWIEGKMKAVVPPAIYNLAHSTNAKDQRKVAEWLEREGYRFEKRAFRPTEGEGSVEDQTRAPMSELRLMKGDQCLGTFKVELKNGYN